jgi:2-polyprenyl-3-methyl-5-hydroxy-6-metoxy-1,4-benzoquinol methylase
MRTPHEKEYCHERLGEAAFREGLSWYDTERRLTVLIDEFLPEELLRARDVLEVGSGLGYFSERLQQKGACVTATDIAQGLLEKVKLRVGCQGERVDALSLAEHFGRDRFDVVLSSECIEHTPSPEEALRQMAAVLKPGGYLAVSTPNKLWYPVVRAATVARLRPFDGYENFSSFVGIRKILQAEGITVLKEKGLHLYPFQFGLHPFSQWCDEHLQWARSCMINICVLGRKQAACV